MHKIVVKYAFGLYRKPYRDGRPGVWWTFLPNQKQYRMILLSWKAKWLEINFWGVGGARSPSQHFSIFNIFNPRLYLLLPRQRNQKINFAQRTFYDSRLLLYEFSIFLRIYYEFTMSSQLNYESIFVCELIMNFVCLHNKFSIFIV